jgi:hypothetical protein
MLFLSRNNGIDYVAELIHIRENLPQCGKPAFTALQLTFIRMPLPRTYLGGWVPKGLGNARADTGTDELGKGISSDHQL